MERPERKCEEPLPENELIGAENRGYNNACDDWEKFLPDTTEIADIIWENCNGTMEMAKAITKRLKEKK